MVTNQSSVALEVVDMAADHQGGIWVGGAPAGRGIYYHGPQTGDGSENLLYAPPGLEAIRNGLHLALLIDPNDTLWIGRWTGGLWHVPLDQVWSTNAPIQQVQGLTNRVGVIYRDSKGAIWTGPRFNAHAVSRLPTPSTAISSGMDILFSRQQSMMFTATRSSIQNMATGLGSVDSSRVSQSTRCDQFLTLPRAS